MHRLTRFGSQPGLGRIVSLLDAMGNPQHNLQYVHIAGTNGKGSTSLIIAEILSKTGCRVGRFISPHLHSYLERISIDGVNISAAQLGSILDEIDGHIQIMLHRGEGHPTEFEVLTAAAFRYFQQQQVDLAVLEVGMGGTYDSTNVITPQVAVITGVDFDHTAFLGDTLGEIAANKAGIIKPGVPVVVGAVNSEALQVISETARALQSPLYHSDDIKVIPSGPATLQGQTVDLDGPGLQLKGLAFAMPGTYQLRNLAVAMRALLVLRDQGLAIDADSIRSALAGVRIPGRLEIVNQSPLVIVDAAHNPQGARALAESLNDLLPGRGKVLVLGLLDDKERTGIAAALAENTRAVVVTRPQGSRSQAWQEVGQIWQRDFPMIRIEVAENIELAVERAVGVLTGSEYMVITGSFYVIDRARRIFVK
ncbi:MAG: folylpolyglutamate synthase/dihydrofolate synthase family protein [Syntrophomonadaceae bacterium]